MNKLITNAAAKSEEPYYLHFETESIDDILDFAIESVKANDDRPVYIICSKESKSDYFKALSESGIVDLINFDGTSAKSFSIQGCSRALGGRVDNITFITYQEGQEEKLAGFGFGPGRLIADVNVLTPHAMTVLFTCLGDDMASLVTYGPLL